jgi:sulfoxide reductase heme-binding subunit YedZ
MPGTRAVAARGAPPAGENTAGRRAERHRSNARHIKPPRWLPWLVIAAGCVPAAWLAWGFASDLLYNTRHLGANPIERMEHFTGDWNLRFLALTLSVTPAMKLTGWGWLIRYRRIFGLFAFAYICLHLTIYFVLDVGLSWPMLVEDVTERIYITLGMLGFLLLVPLAITSTKGWIKRLGNRRWNALHRLVYVSAVLGTIHYWMAVKRDITDPLIFASIFLVLFAWRIRGAVDVRRKRRGLETSRPLPSA